MKSSCQCKKEKIAVIAVTEYDKNNQLELSRISVCEDCKRWYEELGLILDDDQIAKYFG